MFILELCMAATRYCAILVYIVAANEVCVIIQRPSNGHFAVIVMEKKVVPSADLTVTVTHSPHCRAECDQISLERRLTNMQNSR